MAGKESLINAQRAKKDEFYTQLHDIEVELSNYTEHFKGKTVLCNCDDPFESNFFKYFALNFEHLGLKKLIATSYNPSPIAGKEFNYRVGKDGQTSFLFGEEAMRVSEDDGPKPPYKAVVTSVRDATDSGGVRVIVAMKAGESYFFLYGFAKSEFGNITRRELETFKEVAVKVLNAPETKINDYLARGYLKEVTK